MCTVPPYVTECGSDSREPAAKDGGGDEREQVHRDAEAAQGDVLQEEDRREPHEGHQPPCSRTERYH